MNTLFFYWSETVILFIFQIIPSIIARMFCPTVTTNEAVENGMI